MEQRLDFAIAAARDAGDLTLTYFLKTQGADIGLARKADATPVTDADRNAEKLLRDRIATAYPHDGILGEEFGETGGSGEYRWILDPLDGTQSFIRQVPLYGTLVGLQSLADGRAVLGVAYFPALGEMIFAARGLGAWWLPHVGARGAERKDACRARVSSVNTLTQATFSYTSTRGFRATGRDALFEALTRAVACDRGFSDCYGHMLVATGRVDLHIDPRVKIWDCAALAPIIEEAGGRFSDLEGRATIDGGSAVSSNGLIHDAVLVLAR